MRRRGGFRIWLSWVYGRFFEKLGERAALAWELWSVVRLLLEEPHPGGVLWQSRRQRWVITPWAGGTSVADFFWIQCALPLHWNSELGFNHICLGLLQGLPPNVIFGLYNCSLTINLRTTLYFPKLIKSVGHGRLSKISAIRVSINAGIAFTRRSEATRAWLFLLRIQFKPIAASFEI